MNRIEKIRAKRQELDAQEQKRQNTMKAKIDYFNKAIYELTPAIKEMLELAKELLNNNIPLGEYESRIGGFKRPRFVCDGFSHTLGFYFNYEDGIKYLYGIGIVGGGCDGHDLCVSENGQIVVNPLDFVVYRNYEDAYNDFCNKCERFLSKFDNFQKQFLAYVDNL